MAELELSDKFINILNEANDSFKKMSTSIMNMEGSMDKLIKNGLEPLNTNVGRIVEMMSRLSGIKIGDLGLSNTATQASSAAASVAELSNTFDKFKIDKTKPIFDFSKANGYIVDLNNKIDELQSKLNSGIGKGERQAIMQKFEGDDSRIALELAKAKEFNKSRQQEIVNEWRKLQEQLKVSLTSTDKWNEDNAKRVVSEYEKLRKILIDIEKMRSNVTMLPDSPQKASLLGSIDQTKSVLSETASAYEKQISRMRESSEWERKLAEELNNIKVKYDQKRAEEQLKLSAKVSKQEETNLSKLIAQYKSLLSERSMLEFSTMRGQSGPKIEGRYAQINEQIEAIEKALGQSGQRISAEQRQAAKDEINEFKLKLEEKKKALKEYEKLSLEVAKKTAEMNVAGLSKNDDQGQADKYKKLEGEIRKLNEERKKIEDKYGEEAKLIRAKYEDDAYKLFEQRIKKMQSEYERYLSYERQLNEQRKIAEEARSKAHEADKWDAADKNVRDINEEIKRNKAQIDRLHTELGAKRRKIELHYQSLSVKDNLNALNEKERQERATVERYRRLMEEKNKISEKQQILLASPLTVNEAGDIYDKLGKRRKEIEKEINEIEKLDIQEIANIKLQNEVKLAEVKARKIQEEQRQELAAVEQLYAEKYRLEEQYKVLKQREKLGLATEDELKMRGELGDKIKKIDEEINNRKVKLSSEGLAKIERLERQHEDNKRRNAINNIDYIRKREIEAAKEAKKAQENYNNAIRISSNVKSYNDDKLAIEALQRAKMSLSRSDSDYTAKLNELNRRLVEHKTRLQDAEKESKTLGEQQRKLSAIADYMAKRFAVYFSVTSLVNFGKKLAEVRGEMELQQRSLQFLLNDKDKANQIWEKTLDLAVKSPFRIRELTSYIKQMAAYRIESDKLFDTTKRLADVSAGLGVDMSRLILAYGQVRAATFLRGTELRQFTEAGIPMLEALADRFSKLEKRVVTAADVFARISKRQVYFEDVEGVIKEMTDKGGMFYKMQEKQANTLKGMISNLRDSIDIAMNDIGKNNEDMMKSMVSMTKSLADNWRIVFAIIKQTVAAAGIFAVFKFAKGFTMTEEAILGVKGAFAGLTKAGYGLKNMLISLGTVIKAHPILAIASVLTSAIWAFGDYIVSIGEINKKYDEMNDRIHNTRRKVDDLTKSLKDNAEKIKLNEQIMSELSETNDEYKISAAEVQDAQKSNKQIIKELTSLYPMLKGEIDATKLADEEYIETIREKIKVVSAWMVLLNESQKKRIFQDDLKENVKEAAESEQKVISYTEKLESSLIALQSTIEDKFTLGLITKEQYDAFTDVINKWNKKINSDEFKSIKDGFTYNNKNVTLQKEFYQVINSFGIASGKLGNINRHLRNTEDLIRGCVVATSTFNSDLDDVRDNLQNGKYEILGISREFNLALDKDQEKFMRQMDNWMTQHGIIDGELKKFAQEEINKIINVKLVWEWGKDEEEPLDGWRKTVQDEINDFNNSLPGTDSEFSINIRIRPDASLDDVQAAIASARKKALEDVKEAMRKGIYYKEGNAKTLQNSIDLLEKVGKMLHMDFSEGNKTRNTDDPWQKRVQTLIEMHKTFLALNKTFDVSNSKMMTMEKHAEGIKEYLKSVLDMDNVDISTEQGTIAALQELLTKIPTKSKAAIYAVTKAIADFRYEVKESEKKLSDEDIIKRFERQISDYKAAQELIKKGFRPSQIRSWFGFDAEAFAIENVRKKLALAQSEFTGTEMEKKFKELMTKISDIQAEENRNMYENYIEYVKKGIDERFTLKLQELRELENLEKSSNLEAYEKSEIRDAIKKKYTEQLDTLTWNEFKKTDMYTDMFGELGKMSTTVLTNMRGQLGKLKTSLKGLSPTDMKSIVTQINKIDKEIESREPLLKRTIDMYNKLRESGMTKSEAEEAYIEAGYEIIKNTEEINRLTDERTQLENRLDKAMKHPDSALIGEAYDLRQQISSMTTLIKELKTANRVAEGKQSEAQETANRWEKFIKNLPKIGREVGSTMQSAGDFVKTISTSFGTMSRETTDMLENIASASESIGNAVSAISTLADGKNIYDPTKWMSAAKSLVQVVGTFLSASDKKYQREIENREKLIGRLQRAYSRLEKSVENAYSTSTMRYYYGESEKNLQRQIDNYKAMAELERKKKFYDQEKIQEYQDNIEDLQQQLQELQDQEIQAFGGFGVSGAKSAAEEFASAWLDAFMETGSGLNALQDTFDDFIKNIIKNQLLQRVSLTILDPIFKMVDGALKGGEFATQELDRINSKWENETKPKLDAAYQQIMSLYEGMFDTEVGDLSELQKGIQNITEAQAAAIEAYLNSIRFFVSDIDSKMQSIDIKIDSIDISPIVGELKAQTAIVTTIRDMLDSVIGRGGSSVHTGAYLKVMM